jgi:signal transduction histidine kinase
MISESILAEEIRSAGSRGAALTRRILAFSRKHDVEVRVLDLNDLLKEAEPLLRRSAGDSVAFAMVLGSRLPAVSADPDQIKIAAMNLVINAREAMPDGGYVTVATHARDGRSAGLPPGEYASLVVTDSGVGMDAETRARIFEPFFTTKATPSGTGLGLSTVRSIVESLGGLISVASETGRGTTFTIDLPAARDLPGRAGTS